jgi:hypothetical protein
MCIIEPMDLRGFDRKLLAAPASLREALRAGVSLYCFSRLHVAVQRKRYNSAALRPRTVGSVDVRSRPSRSAPVFVLGLDLALLSASDGSEFLYWQGA